MELNAKDKNGNMVRCPHKRKMTGPFFSGIPFVGRDACLCCRYCVRVISWSPMKIECKYGNQPNH